MMFVADVQRTVARNFHISYEDMRSPNREREVAHPRQVAMLLSREMARAALPKIAKQFNRDHSTVIHGIRAAKRRIAQDPELARKVESIRWVLRENYMREQLRWPYVA